MIRVACALQPYHFHANFFVKNKQKTAIGVHVLASVGGMKKVIDR
jgi:hypothetical protein